MDAIKYLWSIVNTVINSTNASPSYLNAYI